MAYYGVSNVIVAEYDASTDKYKNGAILEAVGTSVTPGYSEGTMYLDNKLGIQRTSRCDRRGWNHSTDGCSYAVRSYRRRKQKNYDM